jgi:hypothetical protein
MEFFIPKNVVVPDSGESFLGHAIDAAEVAPIRDGNPQITDVAIIWIEHG